MNHPRSLNMSVCLPILAVLSGSYWLFLKSKSKEAETEKKKEKTHTKTIVPMAPVGFFETARCFGGPTAPMWLLQVAREKAKRFVFALPLPVSSKGAYVVGDGKLAREILKEALTDKPSWLFSTFEGVTKRMTMASAPNNAYCKTMRNCSARAFSTNEIHRMHETVSRLVDEWMHGRLAELVEKGEPFDPVYEFIRLTFYSICEAAFEYTPTDTEHKNFVQELEVACREFFFRQMASPWRRVLWTLLPGVRSAVESRDKVHELVMKVLASYRSKSADEKSPSKTLIHIIEESTPGGDDQQKRAEILAWIIGGHETTGFSLANALVLLAKNPEVQTKLRAAIQGHPKPENVPYFQNVVREANRLVPVVAMGSIRLAGRDHVYEDASGGKMVIPKGGVCFLNQYIANHNESVYQDSDSFDPDRWDSPSEPMIENNNPFSLGARNCPGQKLALSIIHHVLPRLISTHSVELVEEGELDNFLHLTFKGALVKAKALK